MAPISVYRLPLPRWYPYFAIGVLLALSASAVWALVGSFVRHTPDLGVAVIACPVVAWNWWVLINLTYEVRFEPQEWVVFRSLRRETRLALKDVRAIDPALDGYTLRHPHGKVRLSSIFRGALGEIVAKLKVGNPSL